MTINPMETLDFNIGVDVFALCVFIVIYSASIHASRSDRDMRNFSYIVLAASAALIMDILTWITNTYPSPDRIVPAILDNILYFFFQNVALFLWDNYSYCRIFNRSLTLKESRYLIQIPMMVISLLIFSSPWTHFAFYIDTYGVYHRTSVSFVLSLMNILVIAAPTILALIRRKKEPLAARKKELMSIACFPLPVLPGAIFQTLFYGLSLTYPIASLSFLYVYIKRQNDMVSLDALTGLNNRGQMDRFLYASMSNGSYYHNLSIILADLNSFKRINDTYGHAVGDKALMDTSALIKTVFAARQAFLSRYGGDEFAIILKTADEEKVKKDIQELRDAFIEFNSRHENPYEISMSIGYAIVGENGCFTAEALFQLADQRMYQEKRSTKKSVR